MSTDPQSTVKRALVEIRNLRARLEQAEGGLRAPIAIVGMGLRMPGDVSDTESFADVLWGGIDTITEIPAERWSLDDFYSEDPDAPGKMTTRFGAFLKQVDKFDPAFFGISPREAASMDPQQRLLLELAWESLENAAIAPDSLSGERVGVYVGLGNCDYGRTIFTRRDIIDPYFSTGTSVSVAAGRIAYTLGLTGPAVTVDTACSSALVALHQACQALRLGECDAALVGGTNLILAPDMNISFTKGRMMSPDGRCKFGDAAADGYVRGEAGVVLTLKREADARANGDPILALIRGSAINQDGRSSGITAPNGPSQEAVIRAALANAGVSPEEIGYVEAHGTGTALGDPIELGALQAVFAASRPADQPLLVGSVKTNIGHTEAVAGLAGVAKAVLALQRQSIPPTLHFVKGNPHVDWDNARIEVVTRARSFPAGANGRLFAGISGFGFSGTNAHVVLESAEASVPAPVLIERPAHILAMSAQGAPALQAAAERLRGAFEGGSDVADLCHSINVGRAGLASRAAVIRKNREDFASGLSAVRDGEAAPLVLTGDGTSKPRIAFLFTGQGSHFAGMGRDLYATSPVFRAALDACAKAAALYCDRDLLDTMFSDDPAALDDATMVQPAGFALQIGLLALWRSWGIEPVAALGHSLGEYVAAYAAGVMSLEDAMRVVAARGRGAALCAGQAGMIAVSAPESVVARGVKTIGNLEIAAYNTPENVVFSGVPAALAEFARFIQQEGGRAKVLAVPFGSHSRWVEPALPTLSAALQTVAYHPARIALAANLTGALAGPEEMSNPDYWLAQMRQPVRFAQALSAINSLGITHFVEIGPHPALSTAGMECLGEGSAWITSMRRDGEPWTDLLEGLGRLFVDGAQVDWSGFDRGYARRRIAAPTYPFQRTRHWIDSAQQVQGVSATEAWRRVTAAADRQSGQGPLGLDAAAYPAKWAVFEALAVAQTTVALRQAGMFLQGETRDFNDIILRLGATDDYRGLVQRWLQRLVAAGLLRQDGDKFSSDRALPEPALAALWREAEQRFSDNPEMFAYVRHCGGLVMDVITGRESPLETLFPDGSFDLAEGLYERSATMRYINALAASAAAGFAAARPGDRPLRVLEIGGGTGATTASVLPALPQRGCTYHFTDVSDLFLDRAREKFAAFPNVRFGQFDLDKELDVQGYSPGQFDFIVSANAVHACTDLNETLARLRTLLAPGGVLALVESTTSFAWFDFTTGLIEGWRKHDDGLRTDGPLLTPEIWDAALRAAGFDDAGFWPRRGSPAETLGQHLILARAPGEFSAATQAELSIDENKTDSASARTAVAVPSIAEDLLAAPAGEQMDIMRDFVRSQVMAVLRLPEDAPPDRRSRLTDLGLDSLMAVQLRNRLSRGLALAKPLPATVMFDHPTIEALSTKLLSIIRPAAVTEPVSEPASASKPVSALAVAEVAHLSDADIERLLASREVSRA
ncbi:hypothetical protein BH10PSE10_BH10PSE10_21120 [soil metagenome]